ncbi:MAG TPA: FecR domain-containing protein [Microvirga sp.]|jgi:ferric-dicitrate binding protein FerR (iron transport regulator)
MTRAPALALAALVAALASMEVAAQTGCTVTPRADPPGEHIACRDGLVLRTESGSAYRIIDTDRDGRAEGAELTGRGLLIDLPPGRRTGRFQIHTPHAIASVRGTVWAVDVTATRTSVFVREGVVSVARPGAGSGVTLRAGDGIDVEAAGGPLEVKRWGAQRAAALLARFGR